MKLAKLSLAALIALGTYSSISAEPLENVIKNVDVSGYLRYRYTNHTTATKAPKASEYVSTVAGAATHGFKGIVNFKSAIDDNFFTVIGLRYISSDISGYNTNSNGRGPSFYIPRIGEKVGVSNVNDTIGVRQALLGYKAGNTTVMAGRQVLNTFFTDDMSGTGIEVSNNDIKGLTLTGFAFDDLENDPDIGTATLYGIPADSAYTYQHNFFGLAAQGSYDPVNFQIWATKLKNITNLFAAEVGADFGMVSAKVQAGVSAINQKVKDEYGIDNGHFIGLEVAGNVDGFDGSLGLMNFGTKEGKISLVSFEDTGSFIYAGEQAIPTYNNFAGKNNYAYLTAGYTIDKVRLGADAVYGITKTGSDDLENKAKNLELVARLEYSYSKKLNFSSYYSYMQTKNSIVTKDTNTDAGKVKNTQFRFQAMYSF